MAMREGSRRNNIKDQGLTPFRSHLDLEPNKETI